MWHVEAEPANEYATAPVNAAAVRKFPLLSGVIQTRHTGRSLFHFIDSLLYKLHIIRVVAIIASKSQEERQIKPDFLRQGMVGHENLRCQSQFAERSLYLNCALHYAATWTGDSTY